MMELRAAASLKWAKEGLETQACHCSEATTRAWEASSSVKVVMATKGGEPTTLGDQATLLVFSDDRDDNVKDEAGEKN